MKLSRWTGPSTGGSSCKVCSSVRIGVGVVIVVMGLELKVKGQGLRVEG